MPLDEQGLGVHPPQLERFMATDWQGTDPRVGDVLVVGELWEVVSISRGPTIGQFTLHVRPTEEATPGAGIHLWRWA